MRSSCWRLSFIITTSIPYITSTSWILAWVGDLLLSFLICLQGEGMVSSLWEFLCSFFLWQLSVCMECTEGITSLPFFKQRRFLCLFSTHSMNTRKRYTILLRSHCHIGIVAMHQSLCISLSLCRIMKSRIAKLFCFHTPLLACVRWQLGLYVSWLAPCFRNNNVIE